MKPLLVLEINEIPWRILDRYANDAAYQNIHAFLHHSHQYTSLAVDTGELSPWVTWPTLHRGMNNDAHGVLNLGQDPASFRGVPIWQTLRDTGMSIGICGAMQSWPPMEPGAGGFYVPDTFAHDAACFPAYLEPLQTINLAQVKKNPRVSSSTLPSFVEIKQLMACALRAGIRVRTLLRIIAQLVGERFDKSLVARRPIFQTILFWDVFRKHFNPDKPPAYASFFTNHIAGVMHRYWRDIFPEDFAGSSALSAPSREPLMRFALSVLNEMLADVLVWTKQNPQLTVVFASSMGQGPVHRDEHEGIELHISSVNALLAAAGLSEQDYKPLLAMVPQVAAEIADATKRAAAIAWLQRCRSASGNALFAVKEIGISLSISSILPPRADIELGTVHFDDTNMPFPKMGLKGVEIEAGTGYHIPEGSFAVYAPREGNDGDSILDQSRRTFAATRFKAWALAVVEQGHHDAKLLAD